MQYTSKQVQIRRPQGQLYQRLSNFEHFTPVLAGRVEGWTATREQCSFRAKGFTVTLRMVECREADLVKIVGQMPLAFTLWIQLKGVSEGGGDEAAADTRLRLVVELELNKVMKMMIGGKLQGALDQMAQQIADAFNTQTK